jgi:hypothetical protein
VNPGVRAVAAHQGQVGLLREDGVAEVGEPANAHLDARELFGGLVEHLLDFVGRGGPWLSPVCRQASQVR